MPIDNITAPKFFEHLSEQNYDMNFSIKSKKVGKDTVYTVAEEAKPGFIDHIAKWFVPHKYPEQSPDAIEAQAQILVDLFKKHQKDLETNANYKPAEMANNLARKATEIAETVAPAKAEQIQKKFGEAIALLTDAKDKAAVKWYSENLAHKDVPAEKAAEQKTFYKEYSEHEFYKAFGRTGMFRGFNERIHVISENGQFKFYTSPRLSTATQWFFGSTDLIESPARKQATFTKLAEALKLHQNFIVREQYNVDGMIANLKSLKGGRVTRNTNDVQANAITAQIDKAIRTLVDARKAIQENNDNTFTARLWRFGKNWIVLPVHNVTTKPLYDYTIGLAINKTSEAASWAWGWTGGAVIDAVVGVKDGVQKVINA